MLPIALLPIGPYGLLLPRSWDRALELSPYRPSNFYVLFQFVDVTAIKIITDFIRLERDRLRIIGHRFVIIMHFHLHRCALFINAGVSRIDFECLAEIVNGVLKALFVGRGESALLIGD